ncbi:unnamed protein product [Chrysoparadoxa australica]
MQYNKLSGPLQNGLFRGLTELSIVKLHNNALSGPLPEGLFSDLTKLIEVELCNNNLTGLVPENLFQNLTNLSSVDLLGNRVWGSFKSSCAATNALESCVNDAGVEVEEEEPQHTLDYWERWYLWLCSLLWLVPLTLLVLLWNAKGVRDRKTEIVKYFIYFIVGFVIIMLSNDGEESKPSTIDYAKLEPVVRHDVDAYAWNWTGYEAVHNLTRQYAESRSCVVNVPSADGKKQQGPAPGIKYSNCTSSCELSSFTRTATCRFTSVGPLPGQPELVWSFIEDGVGSDSEAERLSKLHTESCNRELPSHMAAVVGCMVLCEHNFNENNAECRVELHHAKQGHSTAVQTYGSEVFNFNLLKALTEMIDSDKNQALKANYTKALNKAACKDSANCRAKQCTGFTEETMNCQVSTVTTRSLEPWTVFALTLMHMLLWWLIVALRLGVMPRCSGGTTNLKGQKYGAWEEQVKQCPRSYKPEPGWHFHIEGSKQDVEEERKPLWEPFRDDIAAAWKCCEDGGRALVYFWDDARKAYGIPKLAVDGEEGESIDSNDISYLEMHGSVDSEDKDNNDALYHICLIGTGIDDKTAAKLVKNVLIERQRLVGMVLFRSGQQWCDVRKQLGQYYPHRLTSTLLEAKFQPTSEFLDFWNGYSVADCAGASLLANAIAGATWVSGSPVFTTVFTIISAVGMEQELSVLNILWLWSKAWRSSDSQSGRLSLECLTKWQSLRGLRTSHNTYRAALVLLAAPAVVLELSTDAGRWSTLVIYLSGSFVLWAYAASWLWFSRVAFGSATMTPTGACNDMSKLLRVMAYVAGGDWIPALLLAEDSKKKCCTKQSTSRNPNPPDVENGASAPPPKMCVYCRLNVKQMDALESTSPQATAPDQGDKPGPLENALFR